MLEITETAKNQITEQLKGREVSAIRIFLNQGERTKSLLT